MGESSIDIYDLAVQAGSKAINRIDKSTMNNIISVFQGNPDADKAFKELILYIARQTGRREIDRSVSRVMLSHLKNMYERYKGDELRENVSRYLTLMKWVYESNVTGVSSFKEFINRLAK
nr:hypothetical protein [Candidatus Baldrarchaeota archaeon]